MRNLKILAKILANSVHMDVAFEAVSTASCDGKCIRIPQHWGLSNDPEDEIIVRGMMDHEALGHGRFTDFKVWVQKFDEHKITNLDAAIHNILEDIFIETMAMASKPGTKNNLSELVRVLVDTQDFFGPEPQHLQPEDEATMLVNALLIVCRSNLLPGQAQYLGSRAAAYEKLCQQAFGPLWTQIYAIAAKSASAQSTQDTLELTLQIKRLVEAAAVGKLPQPSDGEPNGEAGEPESAQSENQGAGMGKGKAKGKAKAKGKGEAESAEEQGGDGDGAGDGQPEDQGKGKGKGKGSKPSKGRGAGAGCADGEQIQSAARKLLEQSNDAMPVVEITEAASQEMNDSKHTRKAVSNPTCGEWQTLVDAQPATLALANRIASRSEDIIDVLKTMTHAGRHVGLVGKRLSSRHLNRVPTCDLRVFTNKSHARGIDTGVVLMCDFSTSMKDPISRQDPTSRATAANGLYVGLADLLDEYGVPFSAFAFNNSPMSIKLTDEDWSTNRRKLLVPYPCGGTSAGAALYQAVAEASQLTQQRRLVVLITDGDTNDTGVLDAAYQDAAELGIDVVTLLLGDARSLYYEGKAERCLTTSSLVDYTVKAVEAAISD